jgi:hypothetical protein
MARGQQGRFLWAVPTRDQLGRNRVGSRDHAVSVPSVPGVQQLVLQVTTDRAHRRGGAGLGNLVLPGGNHLAASGHQGLAIGRRIEVRLDALGVLANVLHDRVGQHHRVVHLVDGLLQPGHILVRLSLPNHCVDVVADHLTVDELGGVEAESAVVPGLDSFKHRGLVLLNLPSELVERVSIL